MDRQQLIAWAVAAAEFRIAAGAERVVLLLDTAGEPTLLDCDRESGVEVVVGERAATLSAADLNAEPAIATPEVEPPAALEVRAERDEVVAPMGAIANLAVAVRELAGALPGASVATAQWPGVDPVAPFSITARAGEPLVLGIGEQAYTMGEGWPG